MNRQRANGAPMRLFPAKHQMWLVTLLAATLLTSTSVNAGDNRIEQFFNQVDTDNYRGNYSIIDQVGNNNSADVNQSYSASYQRGNFSNIRQVGNFNNATINQTGGNNFGVILQKGNEHEASISQAGRQRELKAYVSQSGSRSDIQISQSGSGYRSINVEQKAYSGNARPVTVETY
ncbi:hypothetical protein [Halomonas sp. HL-93]|uniref:hypothetical protein n=1 Tax=Halomonas sp. HL-93 TaxID=1666906 RepID=UPI0006DA0428|nr:hypothetical protein [Halomonas sp. HL-93]KPQ26775.1 MAG: curlin protein [Halomonas sp. HL-93]